MKLKNKSAKAKGLKPNKKLGKNGVMGLLLTIATVAFAISFVFSRNLIGDIIFNNKVMGKKNQVNQTLEENLSKVDELKRNYEAMQSRGVTSETVLTALPVGDDYAALAGQIESMAALAGVRLTAISPANVTSAALVPETAPSTAGIPIEAKYSLNASGSFAAIIQFVHNLEINLRPMRFSLSNISGIEPEVQVEIEITTYHQPATIIGDEKETISED